MLAWATEVSLDRTAGVISQLANHRKKIYSHHKPFTCAVNLPTDYAVQVAFLKYEILDSERARDDALVLIQNRQVRNLVLKEWKRQN